MRIAILNLEPKYKNLALEKVRKFYTDKCDFVEDYIPLAYNSYDQIYCSSIFSFTPKKNLPPNAICGGTGFDLTTHLPSEIDIVEPHLNFGFTTRGCIRKCPFCVVWRKEPILEIIGSLLNLWDGKSRNITLFDNNILALPDHFRTICEEARQYKLRLDFNQGLDHRLLTQDIVALLKSISHHEFRFAFDSMNQFDTVERAINLLSKNGINRCLWYVLVGFDTTLEQDLERLNFLKAHNQNAYVQRFTRERQYISLARWVNQHHIFQGMTWEQFQSKEEVKQGTFNQQVLV